MKIVRLAACLALFLAVPAAGQSLRWAAQNDILTLDPHSQNHATTLGILAHAYEGLVRHGRDFQVEPALAERWEVLSPMQWRFHLRRGVRFHDGSAFAADDVVFSWRRILQPQGTMQAYLAGVSEVRAVDEHTVDFLLAAPNPVLLRNLVAFLIMDREWAEKVGAGRAQDARSRDDSAAARMANGTGAYAIRSWQPDHEVRMSAHAGWWDRRDGNVAEVVYLPIRSDATRVAALLAGDVDLVTDLPPQDVARLRADARLRVVEGAEIRTMMVGFDQHGAEAQYASAKGANPFKDERVRRALSLAIDREAIRRVTMRGLSIPAGLIVAPGVQGHDASLDRPPAYDPDAAQRLLAEAGFPNLEFTLDCPRDRYVADAEICQALAGMWARAGLKVRANAMPFPAFIPKLLKRDTSAWLVGFGPGNFDAINSLQALARTPGAGGDGVFNPGRVSDPRLDALIDAAKSEMDPARRNALLREALTLVRDRHYYVPIHHQLRPWAMRGSVSTLHRANDIPEMRFTRID